MPSQDADQYLLEGVQRGDDAAWRELITRYQGRLLSFCRRMLAEKSEAEDLVQETFVGLLRSLATYDKNRSLETYLFAIVRNKLHDHLRRRRGGQRESLESLDTDEAPQQWLDPDTPSGRLSGQERLSSQRAALVQVLRGWVEQCTERGRFQDLIVIEMLLVLGLRNKEVAADLDLAETGVAGIKFRVLEQWRSALKSAPGAGEWEAVDLADDATLSKLWQDEGVSCLKRTTLGRYLLGALADDWNLYIDFHVNQADCDRCQANLADLRSEDEQDAAQREQFRERCFASSVGFLSKPSN